MRNVTAREFFIHRFRRDPEHRVERAYFAEWEERFASGHPEAYMDNESLEIYRKLQEIEMPLPEGWEGQGGICVHLVEQTLVVED